MPLVYMGGMPVNVRISSAVRLFCTCRCRRCMYERDGLPLEKVLKNIIRTRFLYPRVRPYKTENFYSLLSARKEAQPIAKHQRISPAQGRHPIFHDAYLPHYHRLSREYREKPNVRVLAQKSIGHLYIKCGTLNLYQNAFRRVIACTDE